MDYQFITTSSVTNKNNEKYLFSICAQFTINLSCKLSQLCRLLKIECCVQKSYLRTINNIKKQTCSGSIVTISSVSWNVEFFLPASSRRFILSPFSKIFCSICWILSDNVAFKFNFSFSSLSTFSCFENTLRFQLSAVTTLSKIQVVK